MPVRPTVPGLDRRIEEMIRLAGERWRAELAKMDPDWEVTVAAIAPLWGLKVREVEQMPTTVKIDYSAAITRIEIPADDPRTKLTHFNVAIFPAGSQQGIAAILLPKSNLPAVRSVEAPVPPGDYEARLSEVSADGSQRGDVVVTQPFTVPPDVTTVTYLTLDPAGKLTITFVPAPVTPAA